jgi:rubrerythrin
MSEVGSIGEVIELAIKREMQAAQFYMGCAARVADETTRILFERLAEEELEHKAKLELEMIKEGYVARTAGRLADVDRPRYAEQNEIDAEIEYQEVVAMAIRKERQAFRLYAELAGLVAEEGAHEVFLQLAEEEARHLVRFEIEYNRLTADGQ